MSEKYLKMGSTKRKRKAVSTSVTSVDISDIAAAKGLLQLKDGVSTRRNSKLVLFTSSSSSVASVQEHGYNTRKRTKNEQVDCRTI